LDTFHTPSPNNETREVIFKSNLSYLLNELRKTAAKILDSKPIAVRPAVAFSKAYWGALPFLILVMMWGSLGAELDTLQACLSLGGLNKV
tara:strand:+ start:1548 stop:1817 length:270 start_codon:yes stop_codon:yes gene_type:complete